jgi:hypothetical protein
MWRGSHELWHLLLRTVMALQRCPGDPQLRISRAYWDQQTAIGFVSPAIRAFPHQKSGGLVADDTVSDHYREGVALF